ncbi:MAG: hypothetical protein JO107_10325 [Hyphomicrobiales bacterium]|nr:hypothetical protein [Hyphomicrobiales bacterium]
MTDHQFTLEACAESCEFAARRIDAIRPKLRDAEADLHRRRLFEAATRFRAAAERRKQAEAGKHDSGEATRRVEET